MPTKTTLALLSLGLGAAVLTLGATGDSPSSPPPPSRLAVLWTSGDPEVALNVAFMYTHNARARGWFDEVTLIVWGPSARLLAENEELQARVREMGDAGVEFVACKACADGYGVSEALERLGIEVKYMGVPLTEMLKGDWEVVSF
jgi:hypothetical protein